MKVGIIGRGFVGNAMYESFVNKAIPEWDSGLEGFQVLCYDKYKDIGKLKDLLACEFIFLCLPTAFIEGYGYDLEPIRETCANLEQNKYQGIVILKSTLEPGTTEELNYKFNLNIIHNPEFLTARTAYEDFHKQKNIVLGYSDKFISEQNLRNKMFQLKSFYGKYYPEAKIIECSSQESETLKLFMNCWGAMKVGILNEFSLVCQKMMIDYNRIKDMMVDDMQWMAKIHTSVPGPDGKRGYGGACYPKDTKALEKFMKDNGCPHEILSATINENKKIRGE